MTSVIVVHEVIQQVAMAEWTAAGYGIGDPRTPDEAAALATRLMPDVAPLARNFASQFLVTYGQPLSRDGLLAFVSELLIVVPTLEEFQ